jgi:hypothetical protein
VEKRDEAIRRRLETKRVLRISFLDGERDPENGLPVRREHAVLSGHADKRGQQRLPDLFPFQDGESVLLACGKIKVCPVAALLIFLSLAADGEQRRA